MNRKHRFQVYHTEEKLFLDLVYKNDKGNGLSIAFNSKGGFIIFDDDGSEWGNSDNCVLLEYTGLHDCESERLFEGDLIQSADGQIFKIVWNEGGACFDAVNAKALWFAEFPIGVEQWKKIGNFHQHPERFK